MRRARALATAVALCAHAFGAGAVAAENSGAALVAVVTAEPEASLTRRVRAELEGLGVDVIVLRPPAEGSTERAPLEQAARKVGAIAAVRLVESSHGKIEVWVVDRVTGKTAVRDLDASEAGASDASVAVGAVELLRASLMELHSGEPSHGEVQATPKVESLALPTPPTTEPRLGLAVSGGSELGLGGLGPAVDMTLGVWMRLGGPVGARLLSVATLAPARAATAQGTIDTRSELAGAALVYDLADRSAAWAPDVSLGVAAAHLTTSGAAKPPYVGSSADRWFTAPFVGIGLGYSFVRGLRVRADGLVAWAFPTAHVHAPSGEVGRWGAPDAVVTLGLEVLWFH